MTETVAGPQAKLEALLAARLTNRHIPRRPAPHTPAELSPAQRSMWLTWQQDPDNPSYNVPVPLRFRGPLDTEALLRAVRTVAQRHEVLRSVYTMGDEPAVHPLATVPIELSDADDVELVLRDMAQRPFALDREPPMRATLHRLGADDHLLALTFHHIALDAWGREVLLDELVRSYAGEVLPEPRLQYADYAAWVLDRPITKDLDWWERRLADAPTALDLPTDHLLTAATTAAGKETSLTVQADRVREFAVAHNCSPFMVHMTALQILLARITGSTDITVGVPEGGRHHEDTEQMIGSFLNTLVIRQDVRPDQTGSALLAEVRQEVLEAFGHVAAPFAQIVERIHPPRVVGVTPFFRVLLNVYDAASPLNFPGVSAELLEAPVIKTKFDLSFNISSMRGSLTYHTGLFDDQTAVSIAAWYGNVLDALLTRPDRPIGELPLEQSTDSVLRGPQRPIATDTPLHVLIERVVDRCPYATAVVAADGELTYAELDRRANQVAHHLIRQGVTAGEAVGVLAERHTNLMVLLLGVLKAGGCHVALEPGYPPERLASMLDGIRLTVAENDEFGHEPDHRPNVTVSPDQLAYVIFTSGSTGKPKGVQVEHRHITHYLQAAFERMGEVASGRFALVSTIAADLGLTNVYGALVTGGTLELIERDTAADPAALTRLMAQIDVLKCVPSHLEMLAAHGELASVLPRRLLILAGEPCPWELVHRVRAARPDLVIYNSYGPAETTVATFMCNVDEVEHRMGVVSLGQPLANVECQVMDPSGRPLPRGVPGELWIGGLTVARGYRGMQPFGEFYRTGDRVRLRHDGRLDFLGRLDDQVKVRGFRVELGEVIAALRAAPGVTEAVVLPIGEAHTRRLAAWVAPSDVDVSEVRAALRRRLPDYMVPASIVTLARMPLNANGKVDRSALPVAESGPREMPGTASELRVAAAWSALLSVEEIGLDDDFFALGGDSFQAVRAVREIDPSLRVIDLFTSPTVRELASLLDSRSGGQRLLHKLGGKGTTDCTVVCIPYGGGSAAAYRPLAEALGNRFTTLAVELPGHDPARPDEPMLTLPALVDALAAELATVTGPIVVYGHCVGTAAATALALRLEADGIPLKALVVGGSFPFARLPGRFSAWVNRLLPSDRLTSDRAYRDLVRVIGGLEDLDEEQTETMMRSMRHDAREAEAWFSDQLSQSVNLSAPVLCVIGERDRGTELYEERYREWGAFGDNVTLATIPHAGHYFLKHQAVQLASIMDDFEPQPVVVESRSLREFYTVAFGQTVSLIGNALSTFALGVWAYQRSGQVGDYALVAMLAILPAILFAPLGGAVADRFDRRRIMLACDAASAVVMAALIGLIWTDQLTLWHVVTVAGLMATVTAFHRPAYLAAVSQLVPKPYLGQANALAQLGTGVGMFIAPLAGGALMVGLGLHWVVAIDVLSFLIGLITLLVVRFPNRLFRRRDETFRQAIVGGWRYMIRRRPLMIMTGYFIIVNYLFTIAVVISTPLVLAVGDAADLGAVTAASGIGAAVGSIAMIAWGGTRRKALGMVGFVIGLGVGIGLMGLGNSIVLIGAGAAIWWASLSILNAHWMSMIQLKVGLDLQGRVLATNQMLAVAMTPLAYFTAPLLNELLGSMSTLLLVCGVALMAWGIAGLGYRPLRRMEDDLPNAIPGAETADDLDTVQAEADRQFPLRSRGAS